MKNITLYNNYPDTTYFEEKRKELYNKYGEIQCYDDESDVPNQFVKEEIDYENEVQYNNFIYQMQRLFEKTAFTLYGSIETLLGTCTNYAFIESYAQFVLFIKGCKYLKINLTDNTLKIQCNIPKAQIIILYDNLTLRAIKLKRQTVLPVALYTIRTTPFAPKSKNTMKKFTFKEKYL